MFVVEGDSAGGGAIDGRCPETDTIAKLRGKPLNTHDLDAARIDKNKEFADITYALGCGLDNHFDESKLSHQQIIAMADSDIDGSHIVGLLATFFFKHMRPIIENGHFYIASPPLYEVREGSQILFFRNKFEYNKYITKKILKKYEIGKVIKKDGEITYKPFTSNQITELITNTDRYKIDLTNISSEYVDADIVEFIINNMKDISLLPSKIEKKFTEIHCKLKKNGNLIIDGMYNDNYQAKELDKKFFDSISDIRKFIISNKYTNLYYKIEGKKAKKVFIGELLTEILKYGTPKYRKRFKG